MVGQSAVVGRSVGLSVGEGSVGLSVGEGSVGGLSVCEGSAVVSGLGLSGGLSVGGGSVGSVGGVGRSDCRSVGRWWSVGRWGVGLVGSRG